MQEVNFVEQAKVKSFLYDVSISQANHESSRNSIET